MADGAAKDADAARVVREEAAVQSGKEFAAADANADGKLSREEWIAKHGTAEGFAEYDLDGDGVHGPNDFVLFAQAFPMPEEPEAHLEIFPRDEIFVGLHWKKASPFPGRSGRFRLPKLVVREGGCQLRGRHRLALGLGIR